MPAEQVSPFLRGEVQDYIQGKADEELMEEKLRKAIAIHYFRGTWFIKDPTCSEAKLGVTHMPVDTLYQLFLQYSSICINSRKATPNSLFFAIQGFSKNGNKFAKEALDRGSRYAIVDDPTVITDNRYILVDNVLEMLHHLAARHHQILKTPVIGITGTCGKTTTKELIVAVLSNKYNLVATPGSENGTLSASLALLSLKEEHAMAVIEMRACSVGMIRELARVAQPNYGIITNVGLAHLDRFGSFEGVLRGKGELYDYLRESGGKIFIHKENIYLQSMSKGLEQISYGESKDAFVFGQVVSSDPCLCFHWENAGEQYTVSTHMAGDYNLWNALAAITVGISFNVSPLQINQAISNYIPNNYRSQCKKTARNELIIDTFNANPTSMQAALASFSTLTSKPKAVILGDMLGLGSESIKLYTEIIEKLNEYSFEKVFLCGHHFLTIASAYSCFSDVEALCRHLSINPFDGYNILIKGSNKIYLDTVIQWL